MQVTPPEIREFYERQGETLSSHQGMLYASDPTARLRFRVIMETIEHLRPSSVLDVGCAESYYLQGLSLRSQNMSLGGIDIARSYLLKASPKSRISCLVQADILRLPFRAESWELVLASEVLEHVYDPVDALRELVRVSKHWIVVTTPGHSLLHFLLRRSRRLREFSERKKWIAPAEPFQSCEPGSGHVSDPSLTELCEAGKIAGADLAEARSFSCLALPGRIGSAVSRFVNIVLDPVVYRLPVERRVGAIALVVFSKPQSGVSAIKPRFSLELSSPHFESTL